MTSNKRVKIFLKKDADILKFMWADTTSDGSVMMGVYGSTFKASIEKIFTHESVLSPGEGFHNDDASQPINNTKITFHKSGFCKLVSKIKKETVDRVTTKNIPFKNIYEPIRMLEVLLPTQLEIATKEPRNGKDVVVDLASFPLDRPLRCTVFCMPVNFIDKFNSSKKIDTSIIESSCIYEFNDLAWAWTLRVSKDDTIFSDKFYVYVPGEIVWPNSYSVIARIKFILSSLFRALFK